MGLSVNTHTVSLAIDSNDSRGSLTSYAPSMSDACDAADPDSQREQAYESSRPRTYWCPDGHSSTSADRLSDFGYQRVGNSTVVADKNGDNAHQRTDATAASVCWLPGWKTIAFDQCDGYDTVSIFGKKQDLRLKLMMNPDAITNLRTNIEDKDLWDKASLCRAMGHRDWLPFTVVRDVKQNGGFLGLGPAKEGIGTVAEWLQQEIQKNDPLKNVTSSKWIIKPSDGNKASGILIFENADQLEEHLVSLGDDEQAYVIQEYLASPWLCEHADEANDPTFHAEKLIHLRNKKFDMRIFFLVTYTPATEEQPSVVKAFLHKDGVCRFSTADYDVDDVSQDNKRAHLTNNALNKDAGNYDANTNLISLQDLERLMPSGWSLERNFYPYVNTQICHGLASHVAEGQLPRRGFQLFGIDLMCVKTEARFPEIFLLELNLRPKLKIPDEVSIEFQKSVKDIVDHVICCIEYHHFNHVVERENRFMQIFLDSKEGRVDEMLVEAAEEGAAAEQVE